MHAREARIDVSETYFGATNREGYVSRIPSRKEKFSLRAAYTQPYVYNTQRVAAQCV